MTADSARPGPIAQTLGVRLTLWYAVIFSASTLLVAALAYGLLARSLVLRDHEIIRVKLADYAARYDSSGVRGLRDAVAAEQAAGGSDQVFVRVLNRNAEVVLVSLPASWGAYDLGRLDYREGWRAVPAQEAPTTPTALEVATEHLWDGTVLQVGRTTRDREQTLADVRALLGVMLLTVVVLGLAGGGALTWSAFRPVRDLLDTLRGITRTGQLDARVPVGTHRDVLSDLGRVSNDMLERIATLVGGMREALDAVAHDLRTPIARLRGRAEQALVGPPDAERYREALEDCVEEADRVSSLLTTLMDISEAETGVMRLAVEPVDVAAVLGETVDLYEDVAESRGVRLLSQPPELPLRVSADRARLRQVLANLVDNAVKYTPSGGEVTLSAEPLGSEVALHVRDTGPGIPPDQLPRIWDRLYRGDAAQHERGLGLGLSLVHAVVRAHGGRTAVASTPGAGSTFSIVLPRAS